MCAGVKELGDALLEALIKHLLYATQILSPKTAAMSRARGGLASQLVRQERRAKPHGSTERKSWPWPAARENSDQDGVEPRVTTKCFPSRDRNAGRGCSSAVTGGLDDCGQGDRCAGWRTWRGGWEHGGPGRRGRGIWTASCREPGPPLSLWGASVRDRCINGWSGECLKRVAVFTKAHGFQGAGSREHTGKGRATRPGSRVDSRWETGVGVSKGP